MKHFLRSWDEIKRILKQGRVVILCLDFDGTLAPIMDTPQEARLSPENKDLLRSLANRCVLAVLSGRALEDIKAKINIHNIIYFGNHGLEINGPQFHLEGLITEHTYENLKRLRNKLSEGLGVINGVWVEDKGLTLSVHYRLAHVMDEPVVWKKFQDICRMDILEKNIRVSEGKKVLEVRPAVDWDKGKAMAWLVQRERQMRGYTAIVPVFIGDDSTDEDALEVMSGQGIGVVVGLNHHSKAGYYLNDTTEVTESLRRMLELFESQDNPERKSHGPGSI